jgi:hypothetical protein
MLLRVNQYFGRFRPYFKSRSQQRHCSRVNLPHPRGPPRPYLLKVGGERLLVLGSGLGDGAGGGLIAAWLWRKRGVFSRCRYHLRRLCLRVMGILLPMVRGGSVTGAAGSVLVWLEP